MILADIEKYLRSRGVKCACITLEDGRTLDLDCTSRCKHDMPRSDDSDS